MASQESAVDGPPPLLDDSCSNVWMMRPEVRYRVAPDGVILGVDTPDQWTECAIKGSAKEISAPSSVIGTNLLDAVSPFYKKLFAAVLKRVSDGRSSVVGWRYCADSPGTCRHCMLWIVRVGDGDVSFSSAQFDEHIRHPVFEDGFVEDEAGVVDICGWCKKLKYRDGTKWQSPDTFHNAMTQLGVAPPRALHVKHIACETCAKELSHNGMAWVPFLPRAITDAHSRASLVCCSSDHLLLRELVVRVCATRPWHGVIFPVLPDLPPGVPPGTPQPETPGCPALQMEVARECVRVFVLSNPSCGAIATDEPCLAEWFNEHLAIPLIGISFDDVRTEQLLKAGCTNIVRRPQWKQLKRALSSMAS